MYQARILLSDSGTPGKGHPCHHLDRRDGALPTLLFQCTTPIHYHVHSLTHAQHYYILVLSVHIVRMNVWMYVHRHYQFLESSGRRSELFCGSQECLLFIWNQVQKLLTALAASIVLEDATVHARVRLFTQGLTVALPQQLFITYYEFHYYVMNVITSICGSIFTVNLIADHPCYISL